MFLWLSTLVIRDDHDFGMNNAGRDWKEKTFAQEAFLDFLGEPRDSPRRTRKGVYESYTFRGLGRRSDRSVRIVLLDTRWAMSHDDVGWCESPRDECMRVDPPPRLRAPGFNRVNTSVNREQPVSTPRFQTFSTGGRYVEGVLLGEDQWTWLEALLAPAKDTRKRKRLAQGSDENKDNDPVDLTIVGSSIQVHGDAQRLLEGVIDGVESWGQFPREKARLMELIERSESRAVFLSGDVHHSEIGTSPAGCELPYELVEVTSSGMTHGILDEISNKWARAYTYLVVPEFLPELLWPPVGRLQRPRYIGRSFAELAVDFDDEGDAEDFSGIMGADGIEAAKARYWSVNGNGNKKNRRGGVSGITGTVRLHVRDEKGRVKIRKKLNLTDLEGNWEEMGGREASRRRDVCKTEKDLTKWQMYRLPTLTFLLLGLQPIVAVVAVVELYKNARIVLKGMGPIDYDGKKNL